MFYAHAHGGGPSLAVTNPLAAAGVTLLALALPVALAAWSRGRALAAPPGNVAAVWFGFARRAQWLAISAWLAWLAAVSLAGVDTVLSVALRPVGPLMMSMGLWIFTVLPPALASLSIQAISHDVQRRVRGAEASMSEHVRSSALQLAALLVPLTLLALAVPAFLLGHAALAAVAGVGVILSRVWLLRRFTEVNGVSPRAITTGPLRDRLFDLAARAKVPIKQLYVFPSSRGRLANAFAVSNGTVILTDYLLEHLSEREVVAALAHEIGHLKHDHPRKLLFTMIFPMIFVLFSMSAFQPVFHYPFVAGLIAAVLLSSFTTMLVARRFERVADRFAVDLTGDPEALITALARLARLNHVPMDWGLLAEKSLTHPSTLRRARAIAAYAVLPADRVSALLATLPPAEPRFTIEAAAQDSRLFTTLWKARKASNLGLLLLGLYAFAPAAVIALMRFDHPGAMIRLPVLALAVVAGIAATLAAIDVLTVRPYLELARRVAKRSRERGIDPAGAIFVGLAPAREPRLYENSGDWDAGELFLMRGRLAFLGDETRFELSPADVTAIELTPGLPGWISAPRVAVSWRRGSGAEGTVTFRPAAVARLGAVAAASRRLQEQLNEWQRGSMNGAAAEPAIESLPAPPTGAVTSVDPAMLVSPRALVQALILTSGASAVATAMLGLPFLGSPGFADVWLATIAVALFHRAPYWMRARVPAARPQEAQLDRAA